MISVLEKKCSSCGLTKSSIEFYRDTVKPNGLSTYCQECTKAKAGKRYKKKDLIKLSEEEKKERKLTSQRKYRASHKNEINTKANIYNNSAQGKKRGKDWREKYKDEDKKYKKDWYEKNKEHQSNRMHMNYVKNAESIKEAVRARRKNNRKKVNAEKAVYKARKRASSHKISKQENKKIQALYDFANEKGYHVDHIIPLKNGGKHCLGNLQVISKTLNLNKHSKIGRFTDHSQGICCVPFFEGLKKEYLKKILLRDN